MRQSVLDRTKRLERKKGGNQGGNSGKNEQRRTGKVNGGEIVEINEDYYILVDDRYHGRYAGVAPTLQGAKNMAKKWTKSRGNQSR